MRCTLKAYWKNWLILLLPTLIIGGAAILDAKWGFKIALLSLLGSILLGYAKQSKMAAYLALTWYGTFALHTLIFAVIFYMYNSKLDSTFIVEALANTHFAESREYLSTHAGLFAMCVLLFGLAICTYIFIFKKYFQPHIFSQAGKWHKRFWIFLLILSLGVWFIRPMRALSPPWYWHRYYQQIQSIIQQTPLHQSWHQNWLHDAQKNGIYDAVLPQQTVVLVLSESLTSHNLSACAYPRQTTPHLQRKLNQVQLWCNAYSPHPTTIDALKTMLTDISSDDQPNTVPQSSVLAYAKQAGFKLFWISNQQDHYLSSLFGNFADFTAYPRQHKTSHSGFDADLLPLMADAIRDTSDKKLIILHLYGSHISYAKRYPAAFARFPDADALAAEREIATHLTSIQANRLVRTERDDYDNSILYQDFVLDEIFKLLQQDKNPVHSLIFLSDHGNEVGHSEPKFVGHNPHTREGYRIPIVLYDNRGLFPVGVDLNRPIDGAQLDKNILHIMGIGLKNQSFDAALWHHEQHTIQSKRFPYWQTP